MELFLASSVDIDSNLVTKTYEKLVINSGLEYIANLLQELPSNQNKFEILEAKLILEDLLENFDIENPFLKRFFLQREYSLSNRKDWFLNQKVIMDDLYEEMNSVFNLDEKIYDFLSDEYSTYYEFETKEFDLFICNQEIKNRKSYMAYIKGSSKILII